DGLTDAVDQAINTWTIFGALPPPTLSDEAAGVLKELETKLANTKVEADLLGPSFDATAKQIQLMEQALSKLVDMGVDPSIDRIVALRNALNGLRTDTTSYARAMEIAATMGALLGDQEGSLREEISLTQGEIKRLLSLPQTPETSQQIEDLQQKL